MPDYWYAIAVFSATHGRFAWSRQELADLFGVSVEFFDAHMAPELHPIQRGRRKFYTVGDISMWIVGQRVESWKDRRDRPENDESPPPPGG